MSNTPSLSAVPLRVAATPGDTFGSLRLVGAEAPPSRLIALRNRSGLSAGSIADRLCITLSNYARYETGERKPTIEILAHLASILGVDLRELTD